MWLMYMNSIFPMANGFELSGRGIPDRHLFYPLLSYNFVMKSRSIPGPFQRIVRPHWCIVSGHGLQFILRT